MASHPVPITAFPPPPKMPLLLSQSVPPPVSLPTFPPTLQANPEERKTESEAAATEIAALREMVRQSEERLAAQSAQIEYLMQQHSHTNKTAPTASRSAADTLRTPISVHPSKRPAPVARRIAPPPFNPLMQTPAAVRRGALNEAAEDENAVGAADERESAVGVADMTFNNVLAQVGRFVKPFYGDTNKDKERTVVQFVQNVESVMATLLVDPRSRWRLALVTMVLQDGALEWMQRKHMDISDSAERLGIDASPLLVWDGEIRRAFIQQHLGTDTAELWLAKLEMLVLGSEKTPTPIELDSQFDAIARHVYPTMPADDDENEMLLWTKYKSIISKSKPRLYENIVRGGNRPNTLKGWKSALSSQWLGEEEIKAERQRNAAVTNGSGGGYRGGGRGRGGQYGAGRGGGDTKTPTAAVHAMSNDASGAAGVEGEAFTNEGEKDERNDQQLSAAPGNGQRGGSGERGGRGRGGRRRGRGGRVGAMAQWTELQKERYEKGLCLECGDKGHYVQQCPKAKGE